MPDGTWKSIKGNVIWDIIKEVAKLMLPFLAGFGIKEWANVHSTALMWTAAFVVSGVIGFADRFGVRKSRHPSDRQPTQEPPAEAPAVIAPESVTPPAPEPVTPLFVPSPEVAEQLKRLKLFQLCVIALILKYGELTRDGLTHQLTEAGFPIASELGRQTIAVTAFDSIAGWTALIMEKQPGIWTLRDPESVRALLPALFAR
jgi:hypothetical protein